MRWLLFMVIWCLHADGYSQHSDKTTTKGTEDLLNVQPWMSGVGFGIGYSNMGPGEFAVHGNYMVLYQRGMGTGLWALGPEASIGLLHRGEFFHVESFGLRGMYLIAGAVGPTAAYTLENFSDRLSLDDTRSTIHAGLTFLSVLTVEYGYAMPLTPAPAFVERDRIAFRLEINIAVINQVFSHVS